MLKKGKFFFRWSPAYFCVVKRGFVEPRKMFLGSELPCPGWRSVVLYKIFSPKIFAGPAENTRSSTKICIGLTVCR
jgi:hypothetical protein